MVLGKFCNRSKLGRKFQKFQEFQNPINIYRILKLCAKTCKLCPDWITAILSKNLKNILGKPLTPLKVYGILDSWERTQAQPHKIQKKSRG